MIIHISFILAAIICSIVITTGHETQVPVPTMKTEHVPGVNGNATFCTVPRSEQLFHIHFFDIAPTPVPVEQIFFTYLRVWPIEDITGLEQAQLRITVSAELAAGDLLEPAVYTIPLTTFAIDDIAHITIRYRGGKFGGPLQPGINEILTDNWFLAMFLKTGQYTFKIEAFLREEDPEEDKYLFAFQVSQWLSGDMK